MRNAARRGAAVRPAEPRVFSQGPCWKSCGLSPAAGTTSSAAAAAPDSGKARHFERRISPGLLAVAAEVDTPNEEAGVTFSDVADPLRRALGGADASRSLLRRPLRQLRVPLRFRSDPTC